MEVREDARILTAACVLQQWSTTMGGGAAVDCWREGHCYVFTVGVARPLFKRVSGHIPRAHAHTRERARSEGDRPNHANCIINRAFYMTSRELCRNPALGNCIPNLSAPAASMGANKELSGVWLRTKSPFAFMYLLY